MAAGISLRRGPDVLRLQNLTARRKLMARSLIDISALDAQLQEALGNVACVADFQLSVWRQNPDSTGCNWNARIERILHLDSADRQWWDVVPRLRATLNLKAVSP
jgi:hypothetical protein